MAMTLAKRGLPALVRIVSQRTKHNGCRTLHGANGLPIEISPRVAQALKNNEPVVALESTIITHGMPYPANLETALRVEDTIRSNVS